MLRSIGRWVFRAAATVFVAGLVTQVSCSGQTTEDGEDCAVLCKKGQKECPLLPRANCNETCFYEDARAKTSGCEKRVKAVAECSAELENICTTADACKAEIAAFWDCLYAFCGDHASSMYCENLPPRG